MATDLGQLVITLSAQTIYAVFDETRKSLFARTEKQDDVTEKTIPPNYGREVIPPPPFMGVDIFNSAGKDEFGYIRTYVNNLTVSGKNDSIEDDVKQPATKRRKTIRGGINPRRPEYYQVKWTGEEWDQLDEQVQKYFTQRYGMIKISNSDLRGLLNDLRNRGREKGFKVLFFFVEMVQENDWGAETAKEHRWWIEWECDNAIGTLDAETAVNLEKPFSWIIPRADKGRAGNRKAYHDMQEAFKGMNATLYYPCTVRVPTPRTKFHREYTEEVSKIAGDNLVRPRYLLANFHNVALYLLQQVVALEKDEDPVDAVLGSSIHSLRSIHVMALGIRGLVRSAMGEKTNEWEDAASYCVTTKKKLEPNCLAISSILMGSYEGSGSGEPDSERPTTSQRDSIRDAKISMSAEAWLKSKKKAARATGKESLTPQE